MEQNKYNQNKYENQGLSLIEILVTVVIISVVSGLTIARFGDFGMKKTFDKEVVEFTEIANVAQSYANSRNSKNCIANDRLSLVRVKKVDSKNYEVVMACETNFLTGGTPTILPTITLNPKIAKKLTNSTMSIPATNIDLVTFLPGALTTPGPTIALYSGSECACLKVSLNGVIVKTTKSGCTVAGANVTCSTWDE